MNKDESLALYKKGREAWNAWAEEMLDQRESLIESGEWRAAVVFPIEDNIETGRIETGRRHGNAATQDWLDAAGSNFSGLNFENEVDFSSFVFPGDVEFVEAKFAKRADFTEATFSGVTGFRKATFSSLAGFWEATFVGHADFKKVIFSGDAGFRDATFSGPAGFGGATFGGEAGFMKATFSDEADFTEATFNSFARFWGATFGGYTVFMKAVFGDDAQFKEAEFGGDAQFEEAEFGGHTGFNKTSFMGNTLFYRARFMSDVRFDNAMFIIKPGFHGMAEFNLALFEGSTSFCDATFEYASAFVAIKGQSFFSLKNVRFLSVPDFEQAHFAEAPRLDHSYFRALGNEPDIAARWRALRRLAIQAHDHERELDFFANEIKVMRGVQDQLLPNPLNLLNKGKRVWPGGGRYWAGLFFQGLSNFGRSMLRPFFWWVVITAVFAFYFHYLSPHSDLDSNEPLSIASCSGSNPMTAALYLSVNNGLVISGLGRTEKSAQSYACLYGSDGKDRLSPIMPDSVVFAGIAQTILSAVLIFLFLLALRNYFRIK